MTGLFRPQPGVRPIAKLPPRAFRPLLYQLERFTPPDALNPLAVRMPPRTAQQCRHPAIAITASDLSRFGKTP